MRVRINKKYKIDPEQISHLEEKKSGLCWVHLKVGNYPRILIADCSIVNLKVRIANSSQGIFKWF